jgi:hypothetical protein
MAQRVMGYGVIIISPYEFKQPTRWYYRVQEVTKYEIGAVTCGFMSITNLINILADI